MTKTTRIRHCILFIFELKKNVTATAKMISILNEDITYKTCKK